MVMFARAGTLIKGGKRMIEIPEPCRKAEEIDSISELGLSKKAEDFVGGMNPDELILSVRNSSIYEYALCFDTEQEGNEIDFLIGEIVGVLENMGFIREDIKENIYPESRFVERYVRELGLMGSHIGECLPFYESNQVYESYVFMDWRIESILDFLAAELSEPQYRAVRTDLYSQYRQDNAFLDSAKKRLVDDKKHVYKELKKIFA